MDFKNDQGGAEKTAISWAMYMGVIVGPNFNTTHQKPGEAGIVLGFDIIWTDMHVGSGFFFQQM